MGASLPMSQLFPRSANALARSSIFGGLTLVLTLLMVVFALMRSSWATKQYEIVDQPIQFSHAHHVGGVGLDCRYCHTSVENSSFAGIPPTKTCMNCHSQLWTNAPILEPVRASFRDNTNLTWIRVNDLPDFVYFNHQIHVRQGVGCVTCHGQVDQMPLMYQAKSLLMEWCLDCHRAPEKYIRPREEVFNMAYQAPANQLELGLRLKREYNIASVEHMTSCSICHR
ncbi:MAG TPA: cytochrome c3 family protein [Vicinamibacterales bacterium]|nr:cytochrome c3 family protein [Vicinamibacterales bacterium]